MLRLWRQPLQLCILHPIQKPCDVDDFWRRKNSPPKPEKSGATTHRPPKVLSIQENVWVALRYAKTMRLEHGPHPYSLNSYAAAVTILALLHGNHPSKPDYMYYSLNSLKGVIYGIIEGTMTGSIKGDTRSLDDTSHEEGVSCL